MRWKTICFDLDNTLFSHEAAFEKAIRHCYKKQLEDWQKKGLSFEPVDEDVWFDLFKHNSDLYWDQFENKIIDASTYRRMRYDDTMTAFGLPYCDEEADEFHELYYHIVYQFSEPFEGMEQLFQRLRAEGVKIGIITNGTVDTQYKKVTELSLDEYIEKECIFISEQLGISKPDKQIFSHALEVLDACETGILFVGDSWEHDVVGAIEAGWDAIYLNSRGEKPTDQSVKPVAICRSLLEVCEVIYEANCWEG